MCFHLLLLKSMSFCPLSLTVQMVGVRLRQRCVSGLKSWTTLAWCAVFSKPQVSHWWWWWSQTPFLSRRLKPCQPKQRSVEILCIFGPLDVVSCSNNKISSFGSLFNPERLFLQAAVARSLPWLPLSAFTDSGHGGHPPHSLQWAAEDYYDPPVRRWQPEDLHGQCGEHLLLAPALPAA